MSVRKKRTLLWYLRAAVSVRLHAGWQRRLLRLGPVNETRSARGPGRFGWSEGARAGSDGSKCETSVRYRCTCVARSGLALVLLWFFYFFKLHFSQRARPNTRKPLFGAPFAKQWRNASFQPMSSQRRDQYSNERPIFGVCPAPPASRRSPGSSGAPDPGRRSSPPGRRSHKEPGREGMRFLAAQSPCSPGSSSLPRPGPPSCLLIISFYSFLKRSPVFLSHFSFFHNPRLLASLWSRLCRSVLAASGWFSAASSEMLSPLSAPLSDRL